MKTYPPGTIRALLDTDLVTAPTRATLQTRLDDNDHDAPARFFDAEEMMTLRAACARLIPQDDRAERVDVARCIDRRLADELSDGWRYHSMPPDAEAYQRGLRGLNEAARELHAQPFRELDDEQQDAVLLAVQQGTAPGATWQMLPAPRFFEELLVEATGSFYAHPFAQEEIGYVGMADARGWTDLGLNKLAPHEPRALEDTHD